MKNYRVLISHHHEDDLLEEIRSNANKGIAVGHDCFKEEFDNLTGGRLKPKKRGDLAVGARKRMAFNSYLPPFIFATPIAVINRKFFARPDCY